MPGASAKPLRVEFVVNALGHPPCPLCKRRFGTVGYRRGAVVICYGCLIKGRK